MAIVEQVSSLDLEELSLSSVITTGLLHAEPELAKTVLMEIARTNLSSTLREIINHKNYY